MNKKLMLGVITVFIISITVVFFTVPKSTKKLMESIYTKHQLYLDNYQFRKDIKMARLPDSCYWVVKKYSGGRRFLDLSVAKEGKICLILNEERGAGGGFCSVISFLSKEEALALSEQLRNATLTGSE